MFTRPGISRCLIVFQVFTFVFLVFFHDAQTEGLPLRRGAARRAARRRAGLRAAAAKAAKAAGGATHAGEQ